MLCSRGWLSNHHIMWWSKDLVDTTQECILLDIITFHVVIVQELTVLVIYCQIQVQNHFLEPRGELNVVVAQQVVNSSLHLMQEYLLFFFLS